MKRVVCLLFIVVLVFSFVGCGSDVTIDIHGLKDKIISDLNITDPMDLATDRLSSLYGIDQSDVKDSACFITMGGTFPDEVIMIEAADADAASRIAQKAQARLDDVKKQAKNYDQDSYAALEKSTVMTNGNYVALFISSQCESMQTMFTDLAQ